LREARAGGARPEQEQWPVADAATALDAARLLLWRAATALSGPPRDVQVALAMARLQALDGAQAAVAAARRALDVEASRPGALLDRIARDIATAALVFGKADAHERAAAAGLLPD
jgi:alkylation response protein AidB-like acyl-CoA dehydrogenase